MVKMRIMHRGWILSVCLVLLCCAFDTGALADAEDPDLAVDNEKDIVQDILEDQMVVFEELMEFLGIAPPYYKSRYPSQWYYYDVELAYPTDWEDLDLIGDPYIYLNELLAAFPNYKAIRFYPQLPAEFHAFLPLEWYNYWCEEYDRYIAYDCTDGSTVFCRIDTVEERVQYAHWIRSRCTPEEFQTVQIGMNHQEVGEIDQNTDIMASRSFGPAISWHWLSDDTFVRITYEYDYNVHEMDYYSSYTEECKNGMVEDAIFGWLNPADIPD